jgi:hypothetical protein
MRARFQADERDPPSVVRRRDDLAVELDVDRLGPVQFQKCVTAGRVESRDDPAPEMMGIGDVEGEVVGDRGKHGGPCAGLGQGQRHPDSIRQISRRSW